MLFYLAEAGLALAMAGIKASLSQSVANAIRASAMSAAGLVSRLAGLLSLGLMATISSFAQTSTAALNQIYLCAAFVSLALVIVHLAKENWQLRTNSAPTTS